MQCLRASCFPGPPPRSAVAAQRAAIACALATGGDRRRLAAAREQAAFREILLWMTPSEAPKALQASECSELLDPMKASCWISALHSPGKFNPFRRHAHTCRCGLLARVFWGSPHGRRQRDVAASVLSVGRIAHWHHGRQACRRRAARTSVASAAQSPAGPQRPTTKTRLGRPQVLNC